MANKPAISSSPEKETRLTSGGDTVKIAQSVREMKCYTVTDSELHTLALANWLAVAFFSLASACFAFGMDIAKDVAMADQLTTEARFLEVVVQPISYGLSVLFAAFGIAAMRWRWSQVDIIKRESGKS